MFYDSQGTEYAGANLSECFLIWHLIDPTLSGASGGSLCYYTAPQVSDWAFGCHRTGGTYPVHNCPEGASATAAAPNVARLCACDDVADSTPTATPTPTPAPIKRVFTTSQRFGGNLGGIAGADQKCNSAAAAAQLGGTWRALISTATVHARDRIVDGEYRTLIGFRVARSKADLLDGSLENSISTNEFAQPASTSVWTGSDYNGTYLAPNCQNWTTSSAGTLNNPLKGWAGSSNSNASFLTAHGTLLCNTQAGLFCFEQ